VEHEPDQVRLRIGVALQEAALDPKQTGVEMLRLQGRFYGLSKSDTERRLADLRGSSTSAQPSRTGSPPTPAA
jgi:ABC-2 type transport system ATP-binding protein